MTILLQILSYYKGTSEQIKESGYVMKADNEHKKTIYLAGPEVFLPDALEVGRQKCELCASYGFKGLFPLDNEVELPVQDQKTVDESSMGLLISQLNEALIRQADILVANLTPFRGPSADVGTAYELGFARALGKPIYGYSNTQVDYLSRINNLYKSSYPEHHVAGNMRDCHDMKIEEFGLADNLMLEGGIYLSKGRFVSIEGDHNRLFYDLTGFEKILEGIAKDFMD